MQAGSILIVTGPPGSGKTTAARALAAASERPAVHIEADHFWGYIRAGFVSPFLPESQAQNEVVIGVVAGAAEGYARGGYFVVVDGIVGPWFVEPFRHLTVPVHYVVLRPDLEVSIARVMARRDPKVASGPVRGLYRQFAALDGFERHVIETGALGIDEVVTALADAVRSRRYALDRAPRQP